MNAPAAKPQPQPQERQLTAAQKRDKEQVAGVRATLEMMKPQLEMALPKHITADRLCRIVMTQVQRTPKLLECERDSLWAALMTAAQLGLEPDGIQAHLIPFGRKVQFIADYKGLISLAYNSGEVQNLMAHEVRENDHFEFEFGRNHGLEHRPADGERGEITHFYAYAHTKAGGFQFEVMTRAEVDAVRDASQGYQRALERAARDGKEPETPWIGNYVPMGRKTLIRRLSKYLPRSVQKAVALEDGYDRGRGAFLGDAGEIVFTEPAIEGEVIEGAETPRSRMDELAGGPPPAAGTEKGSSPPAAEG